VQLVCSRGSQGGEKSFGVTVYRCAALISGNGRAIPNAGFAVAGNRFVAFGSFPEIRAQYTGPLVDLGDVVVLPGLINAHCHLDYTILRGALLRGHRFPQWIARINALKRSLTDDDYLRSVELGLLECQRYGTTSVLSICASPQVMPRLSPPSIRTWWCLELIDVRPRPWMDDYAFGSWWTIEPESTSLGGAGLSPHAPYTASDELFRLSLDFTRANRQLLTTHLAESRDEYLMFTEGSGELYEFLARIGRKMTDCGGTSPFRRLAERHLIDNQSVVAHLNELDEADYALLSRPEWAGLPVVHCPKSHRFFQHRPFPWKRLLEVGANLCIGTDSMASNDSLSLLAELRTFRQTAPELSPEHLLQMITMAPARALQQQDELGQINSGFLADAIGIPFSGTIESVYEWVIEYRAPITWMLVDGRVVG
jgi:cytosine/adenosine deaminase-related metal-dependent hydrolase